MLRLQTRVLNSSTWVACDFKGLKKKKKAFQKERYFFETETQNNSRSAVSRSAGSLCGKPHPTHPRAQLPTACPVGSDVRPWGARVAEAKGAPFSLRAPQAIVIGCSYAGLSSGLPPRAASPAAPLALLPHPLPQLLRAPPSSRARPLFPAAAFSAAAAWATASNRFRAPRCASLGHAERLWNREGTRGAPGRRDGRC